MNRRNILSISAATVLGLALVSSNAVAQLKQQVVGTWTLVSEQTTRPDGSKFSAVGSNAKGILTLDGNGRASLQVVGDDRRKFTSNNRREGTAEENKAAALGGIAWFGTYSVNEADNALIFKIEGSTFPNWDGTEQKRLITLTGDELKWTNPTGSGGGRVEIVWKRVK
jgi:hypothetical protein